MRCGTLLSTPHLNSSVFSSTPHAPHAPPANQDTPPVKKLGKTKKPGAKKQLVKWVDLFTCFLCGKEGRSPPASPMLAV